MDDLGNIHQIIVHLGGWDLAFNFEAMVMTWTVIGLLLLFGFFAVRGRSLVPGPIQVVGELFVFHLYGLVEDTLGKERAKTYGPLICALFMFLLLCNWLGTIPHLEEPTKDLNTPLSLGILGFLVAHVSGIRAKGFKGYAKEYIEPFPFMLPLNLVGEIANVISISFRLFGNIMGGSIIILVISHLAYSLVLPPFLLAFFGLFVGTIQAFVFTMLTTVYISIQVK
ncbi:MAG: F0F1 ATP synthase subunit A [Proteobacteria bacterium]|nr:F0F1 ATP synthase subunit A [Pseudomonadota bacterium]